MKNNYEINSDDEINSNNEFSLDIDFNQDLFETETNQLIWILEELDLVTQSMQSNINKAQIYRLREVCKILVQYFLIFSSSKNREIAVCCKNGLKQIFKFFPDLKLSLHSNK
jgi:hypothetical protein